MKIFSICNLIVSVTIMPLIFLGIVFETSRVRDTIDDFSGANSAGVVIMKVLEYALPAIIVILALFSFVASLRFLIKSPQTVSKLWKFISFGNIIAIIISLIAGIIFSFV